MLGMPPAGVPLATLPGMADRTVSISSAGKTFSFTGWKVGWVTGPAELVDTVMSAKQWLTFTNAAPLQPAIAYALDHEAGFYTALAGELQVKRDLLCEGLRNEQHLFAEKAGPYADLKPEIANRVLAERTSSLVMAEHSKWVHARSEKTETTTGTSNVTPNAMNIVSTNDRYLSMSVIIVTPSGV